LTDALTQALTAAVGERDVLVDADLRASYETDWTRRFHGSARAVVRPGSAGEVAAVLAACREHGAAVVPQGGNTSMVGGSVPRGGEVVLSLKRLRELGEVDPATAQVTAGAGVTLAELQAHARASGLDAGVDFGGRDSATVGGMVSTNAGGIQAIRHGTVRARVAGLQAVLTDGSVVDRRSGLLKDNAGYDLPALLVGSEGTLGVVTSVRWRLVPLLTARVAALVPLGSVAEVAALLARVRPALVSLHAAELMTDEGIGLVLEHLGASFPLARRSPAYLLLECAGRSDPTDELVSALDEAGVEHAVVADESGERERLWRLREGYTEALNAAGIPHKMDVGVPLRELPRFIEEVGPLAERIAPGSMTIVFGHLGDGNVHVNVLGPEPDDDTVDEAVLRLAASCGGTISAEHGVGVVKARWLSLARSPDELRAMRAIKRALDPDGMLNPGAVLPPG